MINLTKSFEKANIFPSINLEKHGKEEKELGYTITIKCECDQKILNELAVQQNCDYENLLWDDDGALKRHFLKQLIFAREFPEHTLKIDLDMVSERFMYFHKVNLKSFKAEPVFGKAVKLEFKAYLNPSPTEATFLNNAALMSWVVVSIEPPENTDQNILEFSE